MMIIGMSAFEPARLLNDGEAVEAGHFEIGDQ